MEKVHSIRLKGDGVTLHALQAGPLDGRLVVLLHGFPEYSGAWSRQIDGLAAAGFRVLAPDQRGYASSDKPHDVAAYRLDCLADDVAALASSCGRHSFAVIGHDWGGIVAWWVAMRHRARVDRLMVLNAPHPGVVRPFMRAHPGQLLRSWHVGVFQAPVLPERALALGRYALLKRAMTASAAPGTFSREAFRAYEQVWSRAGALTSMVNWYRAAVRDPPQATHPRIACPCRVLWGMQDRFLDHRFAEDSLRACDQGSIRRFRQCTHWLHHEAPEEVTRALIEFLGP